MIQGVVRGVEDVDGHVMLHTDCPTADFHTVSAGGDRACHHCCGQCGDQVGGMLVTGRQYGMKDEMVEHS